MKKIILLSDSHHSLDERIFPHLEECDEICDSGDLIDVGDINGDGEINVLDIVQIVNIILS